MGIFPKRLRSLLERHRELVRFATVGGICFGVTLGVNYALKLTVLHAHPLTAQGIAIIIATIVSYILNSEWSFRTRGGHRRHHEAALFFLVCAISLGLNSAPLAVSRYVLDLRVPTVGLFTQEVADFLSGMVLGTAIAMVFRWWAMRKWVFPLTAEQRAEEPGEPEARKAA